MLTYSAIMLAPGCCDSLLTLISFRYPSAANAYSCRRGECGNAPSAKQSTKKQRRLPQVPPVQLNQVERGNGLMGLSLGVGAERLGQFV
jgi:hypothetical protein